MLEKPGMVKDVDSSPSFIELEMFGEVDGQSKGHAEGLCELSRSEIQNGLAVPRVAAPMGG